MVKIMFSDIKEIIEDIKNGKIIILMDDEDRENEGDLIMSAEKVTGKDINFMIKYGRGLVCFPISSTIAKKLDLEYMVKENKSKYQTAFTVSIGSKEEVSTGISPADRAKTISDALTEDKNKITSPGHVFPLIANDGGIKIRQGHTEATVTLCKLAGLKSAGVICEIINDDGSMARKEDLKKYAIQHNLKICTIKQLNEYMIKNNIDYNII